MLVELLMAHSLVLAGTGAGVGAGMGAGAGLGVPSESGQWGPLLPFPTLPIHAHLLPAGKVLFWDRHDSPEADGHPRTWDPASGLFAMDADPVAGHDLFCAGHSFLEDGTLFAAGGHFGFELGQPYAATYLSAPPLWTAAPPMNAGRWYPTVLTLGDGRALVLSGTDESALPNPLPQIFDPEARDWHDLDEAKLPLPFYPMAFAAP